MRFHRLVSLFALGAVAVGGGSLVTRAASPSPGSTESATEAAFAPDVRAAKDKAAASKRRALRRGPLGPFVGHAQYFGVTPAVRDLPPVPAQEAAVDREIRNPSLAADKSRRPPIKQIADESESGDGALYSPATPSGGGMPPPIATFEALNNANNGPLTGFFVSPPDTNGDVGPNHYVQTVNIVMRVYNRAGVPQTPVFLMSSLFASIGGPCAASDDGDPIVLYDHLADRWLISQFAFPTFPDPPYFQCIVVSQTPDPAGAYFAYGYTMPGANLNDYPHFGVWPDAYYMTDNQFLNAQAFNGGGAFAFDRQKMLAGDPAASFIYFDLSTDLQIGGQLPADLDGPPRVRPALFAMFTATEFGDPQGDGLRLWEFAPNFAVPAASTFTELPSLPVAAFDPITPAGRTDIPQPGTAQRVDSIGDRIMHRLQYRNFGTYESLVTNHTVDASGDPGAPVYRAGVRYYELRRSLPSGSWFVREQATFAPADTIHRWMGSAAMDNDGNLAVGYSVSAAATTFPGIRYAGRLANDPPGLFQGEQVMQAGSGVQTSTGARWGDYSMLSVDPVDDCTFWYTTEYYSNTPPPSCSATACWQTRVGTFRFPSCTSGPVNGTITGTVTDSVTSNPIAGASVTATGGFFTTTNALGVYTLSVPAGTYDVTASKTGYAPETTTGVVVVSGAPTTANFSLVPVVLVFASSTIDDNAGNNNDVVDVDECVGLSVVLRNVGGVTATGISATLSTTTPGVTVTAATSTYPNIGPGATQPNDTPFQFQTSPTFEVGRVINFTLNITSDQHDFTVTFTVPTGTPDPASVNFNATGPVFIPDLATVVLPVNVSGLTTAISKVRVATHITHTFVGDLSLRIIGPDNTAVLLSGFVGDDGVNYGTDCPADDGDDTIFDDAAATDITAGVAPFVGTFRPMSPLSAFNGKSGAAANGTWRFQVSDSFNLDTGNIECVTLTINDHLVVSGGGGCGASLSINDVTTPETGNAVFNVTLSEPAAGPVTVAFTTADGTATAGADYTATSGTLTFAPGDTVETVTVPILPDTLDENDETFNVNLSAPSGATISDGTGVGTITDDDLPPNIVVADVSQLEGNSGTTTFTFPVTLSAPSGKVVTVHFDTSDGTAVAPGDYADTSGDLTFQVGETAVSVLVNVVGDTVNEPDETFNVDFTSPVNANLPDAQAVGTIRNDETAYFAVTPCRLHDTRQTTPLTHNSTRDFAMTGACLVPANATAVHIIVTTVRQSHFGDLRAWPTGQPEPTASIINYQANAARANNAILPLGTLGQVTIKAVLANPSGQTDVVLDVLGYFQ
jgi:subtilisin-like proprotein convertase family protein